MTKRVITKQLACLEDLNLGIGTDTQIRNGVSINLNKISIAYPIDTVDDFTSVPVGIDTVIVKDIDRGGIFNRIAVTTANGGTIFTGTGYSWERQYNGAINVKWFGAKGDGITDDTLAIQAAIDTESSVECVKGGIYKCTDTLLLSSSNQEFDGKNSSFYFYVNDKIGFYIFNANKRSGATLRNCFITSFYATGTANVGLKVYGQMHQTKVINVSINNVVGTGFEVSSYGGGLAPYFGYYRDIKCDTCTTGYYLHGETINVAGNGLLMQTFVNVNALNCTGDAYHLNNTESIDITNLTAESNGGAGIKFRFAPGTTINTALIENSVGGNLDYDSSISQCNIIANVSSPAHDTANPAEVIPRIPALLSTGGLVTTKRQNIISLGILAPASGPYDITELFSQVGFMSFYSPYLNGGALYGYGASSTVVISTWGDNTGQWQTSPGSTLSVYYSGGSIYLYNGSVYSTEIFICR